MIPEIMAYRIFIECCDEHCQYFNKTSIFSIECEKYKSPLGFSEHIQEYLRLPKCIKEFGKSD